MLVFIRVVNYLKNNLKNILFLWNVTLSLYQQLRKKYIMNYSTYILTTFETEIEKEFSSKKDMMNYLSSELFVTKEMNSICVLTFSLDNEGYKTSVQTKYTFDNRF